MDNNGELSEKELEFAQGGQRGKIISMESLHPFMQARIKYISEIMSVKDIHNELLSCIPVCFAEYVATFVLKRKERILWKQKMCRTGRRLRLRQFLSFCALRCSISFTTRKRRCIPWSWLGKRCRSMIWRPLNGMWM